MALDLPPRRPMTHHNSSTRSPGSRPRPVSLAKIARSSSVKGSPMAEASQLSPPNAAPKRCLSLRARRMVTKGVMLALSTTLAAGGRFGCGCRIGSGDRAEAVLGLPCGRGGQIGPQVRRHVVHDPLEAKPLKGATKPIGELAIGLKIERLAGNRGALHDLTFHGEHGAAARDLFLAFAQPVGAAKVRRDARQHVTESTRDLEPRVAVDEQLSAIGHLAAPFRGPRDHLAGQLPAPNCSHDKSALSGYP